MVEQTATERLEQLFVEHDHVLLDWAEFWDDDSTDAEWLVEPLIPARRSVALFAQGGTGKSLLALWLAAAVATGRNVFGVERAPVDVLYLDYEMTRADLRERLEDMGYGADDDLKCLHYALLPDLAPLDSREGGEAVVALAASVEAQLVVVDTFGRAVSGDENDADTVRAWYRWTGQRLKNAGRGFVRIDHAGKDLARGQRGTSAKNDDVDVVWRMVRLDGDRFRLQAVKRRVQWVPEVVEVELSEIDNVLQYHVISGGRGYPQGTAEMAVVLEGLGVPVDWGKKRAGRAVRDAGQSGANAIILAAQKYRRAEAVRTLGPGLGPPIPEGGVELGQSDDRTATKSLVDQGSDHCGPPLTPDRSVGGAHVVGPTDRWPTSELPGEGLFG